MGSSTGPMAQRPGSKRRRGAEEGGAPGAGGKKDGGSKSEGLYHCDYCHKDLSTTLRVKCAACKDFDLCLECFSAGVEMRVPGHRSDHPYKVVQSLAFPVYHPDWRADEELLLLEAVELYGLGSWPRVAEHVGKTVEECRRHYLGVYVEVPTFPKPQPHPSMASVDIGRLISDTRGTGHEPMIPGRAGAAAAALRRSGGGAGSSGGKPFAGGGSSEAADVKTEVQGEAAAVKAEVEEAGAGAAEVKEEGAPAAAEAGGAAAKKHRPAAQPQPLSEQQRGGQQQQQQQAGAGTEQAHIQSGVFGLRRSEGSKAPTAAATPGGTALPGGIGTGGEPTALQVAATEAQQTGYHIKRREFDPEYDADAETIIAELADFRDSDDEEGKGARDRLIAIYNRRLDERERRRGFILERGLLNTRRQQAADRRRTGPERELHGQLRLLARYLPQDQFEALAEGIAVEQKLRARVAELADYRAAGLRTFEQVDEVEAQQDGKRKRELAVPPQAGRPRLHRIPLDDAALQSRLAQPLGELHAAAALHAQRTSLADGQGAHGLSTWRARRGVLLDIASLPDAQPLSQSECVLCSRERYLPAQYLAIKAAALRLQEQQGSVSRADMDALPFHVDPQRMQRLHNFMVGQGWVSPPAAAPGSGALQQQQQAAVR